MTRPIGRRRWLDALLVLIATTASLELVLHVLEPLGFPWDRWVGACQELVPPSPLHHRPAPGFGTQRLGDARYGKFAGMEYEERFDERGIKSSTLRPQDGDGTRILFLGDSFIQGYDDADTIPQRAYEWIAAHGSLREPVIVLNAAYSSYSPLLFTVQAKQLLPIVRPDLVVVDIDETDLYDDAVRYRPTAVRDPRGRVIAVGRNPDLIDLERGLGAARCSPIYLARLTGAAYYQARISAFERRARLAEELFTVGEAPEPSVGPEIGAQMDYFSTTLSELFETLKEHVPAERILVVRHPHLQHLQRAEDGRPLMNRQVGNLVRAAAAAGGISFFDAQDELAARFGSEPERYYWPGDMHFNFDGIRAYGELVGRELLNKLNELSAARRALQAPLSVERMAEAKKRSRS